ncbi:MAG TPA: DUF2391 family protein [Woeseiaceae bacterium]|nr:DUF2391 family protein [Woeseiaceae bacterium]
MKERSRGPGHCDERFGRHRALRPLFRCPRRGAFPAAQHCSDGETVFLAVGAKWWPLVLIVFATMLLSCAVVFYADFRGGRQPAQGDSPLDNPLTETIVACALSLLSWLLLWSFGFTQEMPPCV